MPLLWAANPGGIACMEYGDPRLYRRRNVFARCNGNSRAGRGGKVMAKNDCPHNSGVSCPEGDRCCSWCGWSPEGAEWRRTHRTVADPSAEDQVLRHKGGSPRQVAKINETGEVLELYPSLVMAAEANGTNPTSIKYHCQGKLRHPFKCTGGYSFRYADEM